MICPGPKRGTWARGCGDGGLPALPACPATLPPPCCPRYAQFDRSLRANGTKMQAICGPDPAGTGRLQNAAGSDPAVFAVGRANRLPWPPSNNVWVNRLTFRACCKVHKGRARGSKPQHPSRSHPPPAPALEAAVSQGRREGYCRLRSSACFIYGSLRLSRVFLPESFKKKIKYKLLGGGQKKKKRQIIRKPYSRAQQTSAPSGTAGLHCETTHPRSEPAASGLLLP